MVILKTEKREVFGKRLAEWRKKGKLPGVIYGPGIKEAIPVFIVKEELKKVFRKARETDFIDLSFEEGGEKSVLIKEVEFEPVGDEPIHVDFFMPRLDKPIEAKVPLVFAGESPAVKNLGGVLVKVVHEIALKGLPKDIPHQIEIPLSLLANLEDRITIKDIKFPAGVEPLAKKEEVIALAALPKKEEEVVAEVPPSLEEIEVVAKKGKKEEEASEELGSSASKSKMPEKEKKEEKKGAKEK